LGQVYYWLGKHTEGQKLFDELLATRSRKFETLVSVAMAMRDIGATADARKLVEEAYEQERDERKKQQAAYLRSITWVDLDDEIRWLERSDLSSPQTKASLMMARGNKALQHGDDEEAAQHLRQAVAVYAEMPESTTSLNDGALARQSL